jgi:jagged-1
MKFNERVCVFASLQSSNDESSSFLQRIVAMLGELLSRPELHLKDSYLIDYPEIAVLSAIVEIKVETAIIDENINNDVYLLIVCLGIVLLIISSIAYVVCLWYSNHPICSRQSEIDLSVTDTTRCHDEEKSNNLQNEENFRRYANPLKNSTCSLRSSSNVELNPIQDLSASIISSAGPSGLNRSQLSIFKSPKDFSNDFETSSQQQQQQSAKTINSQSLYKTQNFDVDKNTMQSSNKDFDKQRLSKLDFKCFSPPPPPPVTHQQQLHHNGSSKASPLHNNNNNNINNKNINNHNSNETLTLHI